MRLQEVFEEFETVPKRIVSMEAASILDGSLIPFDLVAGSDDTGSQ